ncbi:hypothetical protein R6Q59_010170 [Mikania micrantha]
MRPAQSCCRLNRICGPLVVSDLLCSCAVSRSLGSRKTLSTIARDSTQTNAAISDLDVTVSQHISTKALRRSVWSLPSSNLAFSATILLKDAKKGLTRRGVCGSDHTSNARQEMVKSAKLPTRRALFQGNLRFVGGEFDVRKLLSDMSNAHIIVLYENGFISSSNVLSKSCTANTSIVPVSLHLSRDSLCEPDESASGPTYDREHRYTGA